MRTKIFFATLVVLIVNSCVKEVDNMHSYNEAKYIVTIGESIGNLNFSDIVDDCKYIKLETTPDNLIGEVKKVLLKNDRIFILSSSVMCFDLNGKFIYSINNRGRGPGEFIKIDDMSIANEKIYLYDNTQWKIMSYDINNANLIESFSLPYSAVKIEVLDEKLIVDRAGISNRFVKNGRVFVSELTQHKQIDGQYFDDQRFKINMYNQFYGYSGAVYFIDPYYYNVYKLTSDSISNYFQVDAKSLALTEASIELLVSTGQVSTPEIRKKKVLTSLNGFYETSSFFTFNAFIGNKRFYFIYDLRTKKMITYNTLNYSPLELPPSKIDAVYEDYFCQVFDAETVTLLTDMNMKKDLDKLSEEEKEKIKKISNISYEDNPIVVLYKFKDIE